MYQAVPGTTLHPVAQAAFVDTWELSGYKLGLGGCDVIPVKVSCFFTFCLTLVEYVTFPYCTSLHTCLNSPDHKLAISLGYM